ncbi:MAG: hypothetical protein AB7U20_08060 [Planctomycetaceae bacterium]
MNCTSLSACVVDAQDDHVMLTRDGHPVAVIYGLQMLDEEQLALCSSDEFWRLISTRRGEPVVSRAELERRLSVE